MWKKTSKTATFPLEGGLDISNSELAIDPGRMVSCQGWEVDKDRGYKSSRGYERFDGRTRPSVATFTRLTGVNSDLAVGETLTGGTSSATGEILGIDGTYVYVFVISGTFEVETATDTAGTIAITAVSAEADTATDFKTYTSLAAEAARTRIQQVPGEGNILGVWSYKGVTYAFRNNVGSTEAKMYKSSTSGWTLVTTPTLDPDGSYEFINYNFTGHSGTLTMYGCDGENKGFSFDGATFTQITTGMATDAPIHVIAHHNHLFFIFEGGSIQHSSISDPSTWSPVTGAAEMSVGDEITGCVTTPGGIMIVFCRNSVHALYGTSSADWQLKRISDNYGAFSGSIQNTVAPVYIGDAGISILPTTDKFGDFDTESISYPVQRIVKNYTEYITCSATFRHKNQYRVCFSNGEILVLRFEGSRLGGYTMISYPVAIHCISSSVRSDRYLTGVEIEKDYIFFGSDNGYVYQMDAGNSFDGDPMPIFFRLPPFFGKSPQNKKVFRSVRIEAESESGEAVDFYVKPDYRLFDVSIPPGDRKEIATEITGGNWNETNWNQFYWASEESDNYYETRLDGTGCGVSLMFGCYSSTQEPVTIKSVTLRYGERGERR